MSSELFLTALISVVLLLVMAIPGFIVAKLKMIDNAGAIKFLSVLLLYVCQPFVTFNSFLNTPYDSAIALNLVAIFLFTTVLMSALLICGFLSLKAVKRLDRDSAGIISYAGAFGNVGYMCIPFLQLLVPDNYTVILYATCSVVAFNLVSWTIGNFVLTGDKKHVGIKNALLNPPTLSFIIALPLFILNVNFLGAAELTGAAKSAVNGIANICSLFANMVGPLAMTLLGIKLSEINIKELVSDYRPYISTAIKLIISPLLAFALVFLMSTFMDVHDISLNMIALAAMPSANNIMMFTTMFNKDVSLAAKEVVISTVLSCITIPLMLLLLTACPTIF